MGRAAGLDELAAARFDPFAPPELALAFTTPARAGPAEALVTSRAQSAAR